MKSNSSRVRIFAAAAVLLGAAGAGITTYAVTHTQQENAGTANGIAISQADVDAGATIIARVRTHSPNAAQTDTLLQAARETIDYREAVRRGLDCTTAEAQAQLRSLDATAVAANPDSVLLAVEDSGQAPPGYHLTPAAQRTPDTATVLQQYEQDPGILAGMRRFCAVSRMIATVVAERSNDVSQGADAEATFRADLYGHATVIAANGTAIDVREPSATPTP